MGASEKEARERARLGLDGDGIAIQVERDRRCEGLEEWKNRSNGEARQGLSMIVIYFALDILILLSGTSSLFEFDLLLGRADPLKSLRHGWM